MIEDIIKEEIKNQTGIDITIKSRKRQVVDARAIFFKICLKYLHQDKPSTYLGMNRTIAYNYIRQEHWSLPDFTWKKELQLIEEGVDSKLRESEETNLFEIVISTKGVQKILYAYSSITLDNAIHRIKKSL